MSLVAAKDTPALFRSALKDQSAGKYAEALKKYEAIILAQPKRAEPYFQAGRIELARHKYASACAHFDKAAAIKPAEPAIWADFTTALKMLNNKDHIRAALKNLSRIKMEAKFSKQFERQLKYKAQKTPTPLGDATPKDVQRLRELLTAGNATDCVSLGKSILQKHPESVAVHNLVGLAFIELRDTSSAERHFLAAVKEFPGYVEGFANLARLNFRNGDVTKAMQFAFKARQIDPEHKPSIFVTAQSLAVRQELAEAIFLLENTIDLGSLDGTDAIATLTELYSRAGRHDEAIDLSKKFLSKDKSPMAYASAGTAYDKADRLDDAMEVYLEGIKRHPDQAPLYSRIGQIHQMLGRFDEAATALKKAISLAPHTGGYYATYLQSVDLRIDDPLFQTMIEQFEEPSLAETNKIAFGYAIGKAYEKSKNYNKVFYYLNNSNEIERKLNPYDIQTRFDELEKARNFYRDFDSSKYSELGNQEFEPIFVTGLARSGTTLTEQIIGGHSSVTVGGEDGRLNSLIKIAKSTSTKQLRTLHDLDEKILGSIAEHAIAHFDKRFPGKTRVTDKAISTYKEMGLVKAVFPKAKFVLLRRDPRDNLLSMYKNRFIQGTHLYTNSLTDLAHYHNTYLDYIDLWKQVMPGEFYELKYEKLTENPEEEARKLIDYCGLVWEDSCLNFHENKSTVRTLSIYQARQPIYKSSVALWENYKEELKPMMEVLESRGE